MTEWLLPVGLAWITIMAAIMIKISWRDEFGRPWYRAWTYHGKHHQSDRDRHALRLIKQLRNPEVARCTPTMRSHWTMTSPMWMSTWSGMAELYYAWRMRTVTNYALSTGFDTGNPRS